MIVALLKKTSVSSVHSSKASGLIVTRLVGNTTDSNAEHSVNAVEPIDVIFSGISIDVSAKHCVNIASEIIVSDVVPEKDTDLKRKQPSKALSPIVVCGREKRPTHGVGVLFLID